MEEVCAGRGWTAWRAMPKWLHSVGGCWKHTAVGSSQRGSPIHHQRSTGCWGLGEQKAYARLDGLLPHGELKRWVADRPEFDVVPDGRGMTFIWAASGAARATEDEPAVGGTAPDQSAPGPALALAIALALPDPAPSDAAAPYDAQEWGRSRGRSWSTGVPNMVRRVGRCWWQDANYQGPLQDDEGKWWLQ